MVINKGRDTNRLAYKSRHRKSPVLSWGKLPERPESERERFRHGWTGRQMVVKTIDYAADLPTPLAIKPAWYFSNDSLLCFNLPGVRLETGDFSLQVCEGRRGFCFSMRFFAFNFFRFPNWDSAKRFDRARLQIKIPGTALQNGLFGLSESAPITPRRSLTPSSKTNPKCRSTLSLSVGQFENLVNCSIISQINSAYCFRTEVRSDTEQNDSWKRMATFWFHLKIIY